MTTVKASNEGASIFDLFIRSISALVEPETNSTKSSSSYISAVKLVAGIGFMALGPSLVASAIRFSTFSKITKIGFHRTGFLAKLAGIGLLPLSCDSKFLDDTNKDQASPDSADWRLCKTTPSANERDWIEAKNERCCEGLIMIELLRPSMRTGICENFAPPSAKLCTFCGDGSCTPPENSCNCNKDCR